MEEHLFRLCFYCYGDECISGMMRDHCAYIKRRLIENTRAKQNLVSGQKGSIGDFPISVHEERFLIHFSNLWARFNRFPHLEKRPPFVEQVRPYKSKYVGIYTDNEGVYHVYNKFFKNQVNCFRVKVFMDQELLLREVKEYNLSGIVFLCESENSPRFETVFRDSFSVLFPPHLNVELEDIEKTLDSILSLQKGKIVPTFIGDIRSVSEEIFRYLLPHLYVPQRRLKIQCFFDQVGNEKILEILNLFPSIFYEVVFEKDSHAIGGYAHIILCDCSYESLSSRIKKKESLKKVVSLYPGELKNKQVPHFGRTKELIHAFKIAKVNSLCPGEGEYKHEEQSRTKDAIYAFEIMQRFVQFMSEVLARADREENIDMNNE